MNGQIFNEQILFGTDHHWMLRSESNRSDREKGKEKETFLFPERLEFLIV